LIHGLIELQKGETTGIGLKCYHPAGIARPFAENQGVLPDIRAHVENQVAFPDVWVQFALDVGFIADFPMQKEKQVLGLLIIQPLPGSTHGFGYDAFSQQHPRPRGRPSVQHIHHDKEKNSEILAASSEFKALSSVKSKGRGFASASRICDSKVSRVNTVIHGICANSRLNSN
jgi:hypothetical protein